MKNRRMMLLICCWVFERGYEKFAGSWRWGLGGIRVMNGMMEGGLLS